MPSIASRRSAVSTRPRRGRAVSLAAIALAAALAGGLAAGPATAAAPGAAAGSAGAAAASGKDRVGLRV
ncbi:MAG: hypothetical protein ACRCZD_12675, partial [Phycicoccus sp.]